MANFFPQTIEFTLRGGAYFLSTDDFKRAIFVSQVLLARVLNQDRAFLLAHPEKVISEQERSSYSLLLEKYKEGKPLAYLCGSTEFYSLNFIVNPHVLIPRHETEILVDEAITMLKTLPTSAPSILELGTGSGAIAISFAVTLEEASITAIDLSEEALAVAKENAKRLSCQHIRFRLSHWFNNVPEEKFDCIVSNPPYLRPDEWRANESLHAEPCLALIGGNDGLDAYREISIQAKKYLKENGILLFEHGYSQGEAVRDILQQAGYRDVSSVPDLLGHERVTSAILGD